MLLAGHTEIKDGKNRVVSSLLKFVCTNVLKITIYPEQTTIRVRRINSVVKMVAAFRHVGAAISKTIVATDQMKTIALQPQHRPAIPHPSLVDVSRDFSFQFRQLSHMMMSFEWQLVSLVADQIGIVYRPPGNVTEKATVLMDRTRQIVATTLANLGSSSAQTSAAS